MTELLKQLREAYNKTSKELQQLTTRKTNVSTEAKHLQRIYQSVAIAGGSEADKMKDKLLFLESEFNSLTEQIEALKQSLVQAGKSIQDFYQRVLEGKEQVDWTVTIQNESKKVISYTLIISTPLSDAELSVLKQIGEFHNVHQFQNDRQRWFLEASAYRGGEDDETYDDYRDLLSPFEIIDRLKTIFPASNQEEADNFLSSLNVLK